MPIHWRAWHDTMSVLHKKIPQTFLDERMGVPAHRIIEEYNQIFGEHVDTEQFIELKQQKAMELLPQTQGIEPVVEIVRSYQGKLPMAVASGGTRKNVLFTLKAIGLESVFDAVVTADDDVAPKPSPEIFLEAARRLGTDPKDCIVFEDGDPGILGAQEAGMMVVDVREYLGK